MQVAKPGQARSWAVQKQMLPKNWCQIVSKSLTDAGYSISADQVSDIRMGKIKNIENQLAVWREIRKLEKQEKMTRRKLEAVKN